MSCDAKFARRWSGVHQKRPLTLVASRRMRAKSGSKAHHRLSDEQVRRTLRALCARAKCGRPYFPAGSPIAGVRGYGTCCSRTRVPQCALETAVRRAHDDRLLGAHARFGDRCNRYRSRRGPRTKATISNRCPGTLEQRRSRERNVLVGTSHRRFMPD